MEATWYLRMFGVSKEDTVAHQTGMMYRSVTDGPGGFAQTGVSPGVGLLHPHAPWWLIISALESKHVSLLSG